MINNLLLVLSLSGFALGVMACSLLLFSNKIYRHASRLLATAFICMVSILLVTFLFVWNSDFYAYVYRFPSPLLYLLFPVSYLYIRAVIKDETQIRKIDGVHFLLPVFYLIEIFPHYFSSYEYRRNIVKEFSKHPDKFIDLNVGLLPSFYHTILLILQAVIYMILIVMLLKKSDLYTRKAATFRWIKVFVFFISINFLPMLCFLFCPAHLLNYAFQFILIILTLSFLIINLYLFTRPEILYGIPQTIMALPETVSADEVEQPFKTNDNHPTVVLASQPAEKKPEFSNLERYKPLLESYMHLKKPFLKQGYSINALSTETGIPQHHLSAMINRIYEMRFNEYLNRLRIEYISENFKNTEWEKLTLEGIAKQAGFTSRTTFFNTIKKIMGLSPSEYIARIKQES